LIFTNYVGIQKIGVVIDRFTGDEVWNQPVVGYRILPLRSQDILNPIEREGRKIYPVQLRVKLYWADDNVPTDYVSVPFSIANHSKDEESILSDEIPEGYTGRAIAFKLFFDAPLRINGDGTEVIEAGRIVGEGIWSHQEKPPVGNAKSLNQTHPDFIWLPLRLGEESGGANPYIRERQVRSLQNGQSGGGGSGGSAQKLVLGLKASEFRGYISGDDMVRNRVKRRINFILKREGLTARLTNSDIEVNGESVRIAFDPELVASQGARIQELIIEAGYSLTNES
jgi:hypothetical protein